MHQTIRTTNINECTKIRQTDHVAGSDFSRLELLDEHFDFESLYITLGLE